MAIAYDNATSAVGNSTNTTIGHTIAAQGNDRILVAFFHAAAGTQTASTMSGATYNGIDADGSFTSAIMLWGNWYTITAFYWLESSLPANGSPTAYNLVGTTGAGSTWGSAGYCSSYTGVNQIAPVESDNGSNDQGDLASTVSITTPAVDSVIADAAGTYASSNHTLTENSGQTKIGQVSLNSQADMAHGYEAVSTVQSYAQTWTFSTEYTWQAAAYAFGPSSSGVDRRVFIIS